nr:ankyrin repeat domain-containing protein 40-like isoform X1 [Anolis sagrei ordinatus]
MSGPSEQRLREAAARGALEEVRALLGRGACLDAPDGDTGWTCLHWACKQNHTEVVAYLLDSGANKEIFTINGELAADLTSEKEIRKLLGVEECHSQEAADLKRPFSANDPANPFLFTDKDERDSALDASAPSELTSIVISSLSEGKANPCSSATQAEDVCTATSLQSGDHSEGDLLSPISTGATAFTAPTVQDCLAYPSPAGHNGVLFSLAASRQHVPQQANGSFTSATHPLQPLFHSEKFPYNAQELVLKVRIQNPKEDDFIEIELDRQDLTYQGLLRVSSCELGINPEQVEKIRKLPNTWVRKDKDVTRLQDFQELELVLEENTSSFRNAVTPTTMDKPCYNTKAAKLTY